VGSSPSAPTKKFITSCIARSAL